MKKKACVIADDPTGANATGALIAKRGFKVATVLGGYQNIDFQKLEEYDVVVASTDSRYLEKEEAYERVMKTFQTFREMGTELIAKRIDTTLRGNVGTEIDAVLDAADPEYIAIVVPSYPSAGRICIGGHVLVNSVPLNETEVIRDSKFPFNTSKVIDIIKLQSKRNVVHIPYDLVQSSESEIIRILSSIPKGSIVVIDAVTNKDIQKIARICVESKVPFIPVDPGPFTAAVISTLFAPEAEEPRILLVIGSVTELTRKQVKHLTNVYNVKIVKPDVKRIFDSNMESEVEKVAEEAVEALKDFPIVGVVTALEDSDIISAQKLSGRFTEKEIYERLNNFIGLVTLKILESQKDMIKGLYVSGGETLKAVTKYLGAAGINIEDEVYPLTVYGTIVGGKFEGLPLVTKGGLIGTEDTLKLCVDYLKRASERK